MNTQAPLTYIVAIEPQIETELSTKDSVLECGELARTAGLKVVGSMIQKRNTPHHKLYVGTGKVDELKEVVTQKQVEVLLTDDELTPIQHRTLEKELNIKVMDRTGLILEIFAMRASTAEAILQVELAQLEYLRPRLTRLWTHLSRQTGGIGTKGPGETQLEVDKRQIGKRISTIKQKLKKIKNHREVTRLKRQTIPLLSASLVGYTNAGKSTLLNQLTQSRVLAENKLFATLDPTTRKLTLPNNQQLLLTDTVGFIQKLPHELVTSFQATLEEILESHLILHVVDLSNPNFELSIQTANNLLKSLGAEEIPMLYIFNKADLVKDLHTIDLSAYSPHTIISAKQKANFDVLFKDIQNQLSHYEITKTLRLPYNRMDIVSSLKKYGKILDEQYDKEITITVQINKIIAEKIIGNLYND